MTSPTDPPKSQEPAKPREPPKPQSPERRPQRRPFEGVTPPAPFHRSPEFQRLVWLGGACSAALVLGLYMLSRTPSRSAPNPASVRIEAGSSGAPPARADPTPEEKEAEEIRLSTLFEGALADSRNGQGFAVTPGYLQLLRIVMSYPREQFSSLATRPLDWGSATANPGSWRGEFVRARGVIAHRWAERLHDPVLGVRDVYRVILTDGDGSDGIVVDMLEEPPAVSFQSDPVDVEGIFYRTVRFESAEERTGEREAPYLLARSMRPVEKPKRDATGFLRNHGALALVAAALAIGVARLLIYVFPRRRRRQGTNPEPAPVGFHKMFENRLREEDRKSGPRAKN